MGYQLWTSPITGYRRRGTKLSDFNEAFGQKITIAAVLEPLKSCPAEAPSNEMRDVLEQRDFDVAGVRRSANDPVIGFVYREDLNAGLVKDHVVEIPARAVFDDSAAVYSVFDTLKEDPFVLVRTEGVIDGIMTRADLNKPVVRVYFFGLISLLEIHLSFWVNQAYSDERWKEVIGAKRVVAALRTQAERRRRGQELPLKECLQFSDKHKLVIQDGRLRADLALGTKRSATRYLGKAENLRNSLAHSQYDLTAGQSWTDLINLIQMIDSTIALSDQLVEAQTVRMATEDLGALW